MKKFYIGSLELQVTSNEEMELWQKDELFGYPILPVWSEKNIDIHIVPVLPSTVGTKYRAPGMVIYKHDEEEWRVYGIVENSDAKKYIPEMVSRRSGSEGVNLFIKQDWWTKNHKTFRPWFYIHIEELLLENQAMILHSASIIYRGYSILFTAPSGTGKTTQTNLWHQYLDGVEDLNGDRTLIQYTPDGWYGSGIPVFGSTMRCEQKAAPIKAIVILRQGTVNEIRELSSAQKTGLLYSEITVPHFDKGYIEIAMLLLEKLIWQIPVLFYSCTMCESAVTTLYQYLYGGAKDGNIRDIK